MGAGRHSFGVPAPTQHLQACSMLPLLKPAPGNAMDGTCSTESTSPPSIHPINAVPQTTHSSSPSTSVHTCTLTVDQLPADSPSQKHRFRNHLELRTAWLLALSRADDHWSAMPRFHRCGQNCWTQYSPSRDTYRTVANSCNLRICPICGDRIRKQTAAKAAAALDGLKSDRLKLITLTLKSSSAPLVDQLRNLRIAFRKLRQRHLWKDNVTAGFAVIEMTFNEKIRHWHPHLHIVCDAPFIPHAHLKNHWLSITKTSSIVDIRPCAPGLNIARYLSKYLGKPPALTKLDHETHRLLELRTALAGSRMLLKFGKMPEHDDKDPPDDQPPHDWQQYQPMEEIIVRFRNHDPTAIYIMQCLTHDTGFAQTPRDEDPSLARDTIDDFTIGQLHPPDGPIPF